MIDSQRTSIGLFGSGQVPAASSSAQAPPAQPKKSSSSTLSL